MDFSDLTGRSKAQQHLLEASNRWTETAITIEGNATKSLDMAAQLYVTSGFTGGKHKNHDLIMTFLSLLVLTGCSILLKLTP